MSIYCRPSGSSGMGVVLAAWLLMLPPHSSEELLACFCFLSFRMASGIPYQLPFGDRCGPFSYDSHPCFKGIILTAQRPVPCLWFSHPSLQLYSLSLISKVYFFQSNQDCIFLQALLWGVFSRLFKGLIFPVSPEIVGLFMVKFRPF